MPTYSWTSRSADLSHSVKRDATSALAPDQTKIAAAQLLDPIAEFCRLLELEIRRRRLHLGPQICHVRVELGLGAEAVALVGGDGYIVSFIDAAHDLVDALDDRGRRNSVLGVVGLLNGAA